MYVHCLWAKWYFLNNDNLICSCLSGNDMLVHLTGTEGDMAIRYGSVSGQKGDATVRKDSFWDIVENSTVSIKNNLDHRCVNQSQIIYWNNV